MTGIDVVVLAGGLGTRIRAVLGDVPKILAPINGRAFLDHLLGWLADQGAGRVVLSLGHLGERVIDHLTRHPGPGLPVVPVIEPAPLGTGGALRHVRPHLGSDPVLVLNGDTVLGAELPGFIARHRAAHADLSLLCAEVGSVARFGQVELDGHGHLRRFVEKEDGRDRPGLINGGFYLFSTAALARLMATSGPSLERDFLQVQPPGTIRAEIAPGPFVDIGTPDGLAEAARMLSGHGRIPSERARGGRR